MQQIHNVGVKNANDDMEEELMVEKPKKTKKLRPLYTSGERARSVHLRI